MAIIKHRKGNFFINVELSALTELRLSFKDIACSFSAPPHIAFGDETFWQTLKSFYILYKKEKKASCSKNLQHCYFPFVKFVVKLFWRMRSLLILDPVELFV